MALTKIKNNRLYFNGKNCFHCLTNVRSAEKSRKCMKKLKAILNICLVSFVVICGTMLVTAQTTEFSYQGSLNTNGASANGTYDFEFRLFNVATGGTPIDTLQRSNVTVTDGVFSVGLNFGELPSENRFLEIGVRPAGSGPYTTLSPRTKLVSAPYAILAINAQNAASAVNAQNAGNSASLNGQPASFYTNASNLSSGTVPTARLSNNTILNQTTLQPSSNFNISGNGVAGGSLSGNIVSAATQFNIGQVRVLWTPGSTNFYAGSRAGESHGSAFSNSFVGSDAGRNITTGSRSTFVGHNAGFKNTNGGWNTFVGHNAGYDNSTGGRNSFFGQEAGYNSTGDRNSFFGY